MSVMVIRADSSLQCLVTIPAAELPGGTLVGSTVTANATMQDGKAVLTQVDATVAITGATTFTATFPEGVGSPNVNTLSFGKWQFQARAVIGSESEIVVEKIIQVDPAYL